MKQKTLEYWLKFIIIGLAVCGILIYAAALPEVGSALADQYPEFAHWYQPWLIFLWITVIPCYGVLIFGWKVASNIGKGKSFSFENGTSMKWISRLAGGDCIFFFVGNIVLWLSGRNHPGIMILAMVVLFFGLAVAISAKVLSELIDNAAELKEENDLTI